MSGSNFKNGSLVMRVWPDGSGSVLAKFQYFTDALEFASLCADRKNHAEVFYLAVCDESNEMKCFKPANPPQERNDAQ